MIVDSSSSSPIILAMCLIGCGSAPSSDGQTEAATGSSTGEHAGSNTSSQSTVATDGTGTLGSSTAPTTAGEAGSDTTDTDAGDPCEACPTDGVLTTMCIADSCVASACESTHLLCGDACCAIETVADAPFRINGELADGTLFWGDHGGTFDEECRWYTFDGSAWTSHDASVSAYGGTRCVVSLTDDGDVHFAFQTGDPAADVPKVAMVSHASEGHAPYELYASPAAATYVFWVAEFLPHLNGLFLVTREGSGAENSFVRTADSWTPHADFVVQQANVGDQFEVALDSEGQPHVALYQDAEGCFAYASPVAAEGFEAFEAQPVDCSDVLESSMVFALDDEDEPHMLYYAQQADELRWAHRAKGEWVRVVVEAGDVLEPGAQPGSSLAIDAHQNPHVVYQRNDQISVYGQFDGVQWQLRDLSESYWSVFADRGGGVHLLNAGIHTLPLW